MMNSSTLRQKGIRGFAQVLFSNCVMIIMGIVSSFIVPGRIAPVEFGYWQTYLLYDAYVGLALFGYCDGIYLRYGGREYGALQRQLFSSFFVLMVLYLLGVAMCLSLLVSYLDINAKDKYILYAVVVSMVLRCTVSFFILINQATARFKVYSIGNMIERVFFVCTIVVLIFFSYIDMYRLIVISLIGQAVALIYNIITSRDLFDQPLGINRFVWGEIKENMAAGFPLTMYGISSMLMTGIGRFCVERYLGKEQFGYYSFAFPMMAVISHVIAAASLVLFPILKQSDDQSIHRWMDFVDKWSLPAFAAIMCVYIPANVFINVFLPIYRPALPCLLTLLPMLYFNAKITIVYNTILKVQRKEKTMMTVSCIAALSCAIFTSIVFKIHPSLVTVAACTTASYMFWQFMLKRALKRPSYKLINGSNE